MKELQLQLPLSFSNAHSSKIFILFPQIKEWKEQALSIKINTNPSSIIKNSENKTSQ